MAALPRARAENSPVASEPAGAQTAQTSDIDRTLCNNGWARVLWGEPCSFSGCAEG